MRSGEGKLDMKMVRVYWFGGGGRGRGWMKEFRGDARPDSGIGREKGHLSGV
jgi:hypothetical protein